MWRKNAKKSLDVFHGSKNWWITAYLSEIFIIYNNCGATPVTNKARKTLFCKAFRAPFTLAALWYKFPHIEGEQEHHGILGWKGAYRDVDSLFMYCLSDRFTYRQMNKPDSQLSITEREICKELEEATGAPFYYYLFHYKKTPETCPVCGGEWTLTGGENLYRL